MKTRLTDFAATAKAWLAGAAALVATLATYVVPESSLGRVLTSAGAFLATLLIVFRVENKAPKAPADNYLG